MESMCLYYIPVRVQDNGDSTLPLAETGIFQNNSVSAKVADVLSSLQVINNHNIDYG